MGRWVNERKGIRKALVRFPGGALRTSSDETQSNPLPPTTGPDTPRSNTCMWSPRCVFWKQCPTAPTTCGWKQVMVVGPVGSVFPLLPHPFPSRLGLNLDQHGRLHEVMSTKALIKARPFITERNLGLEAEMKASTDLPEDPSRCLGALPRELRPHLDTPSPLYLTQKSTELRLMRTFWFTTTSMQSASASTTPRSTLLRSSKVVSTTSTGRG